MAENYLVSIAPMMECTDRHDRFFLRLISPHTLLYTEMITAQALIHGDAKRLLDFDPFEHPIALQLGGNNPEQLAYCASLGEAANYDEINLNVGCPSSRVKSGQFGACLMLTPTRVAECVALMQKTVKIPISVKCRIGVDDHDSYAHLTHFIKEVTAAGCTHFIIHARKAWLQGLSPKQNRDIPPLCYETVYQIKKDFPNITVIINGGITTVSEIKKHLEMVDGVMIGRKAYSQPYFLAEIERAFFATEVPARETIIERFIPYVENALKMNIKLTHMTRHILGLFAGEQGGRRWRRYLSEHAYQPESGIEIIRGALKSMKDAT